MSFARLLAVWIIILCSATSTPAQTTATLQDEKNKSSAETSEWIEDKVSVRVEAPYISADQHLVLAYTVTNKSGKNITIDYREDKGFMTPRDPRSSPVTVFFKLKDRESYVQITPESLLISFDMKLLPADLPVLFQIVWYSTIERSWFFWESAEKKLWNAINKELGNAESIAVFIPDRKLKISFPIPKPPSK